MVKTGKTPSQLLSYLYSKVGEHYYDRIDLHFPKKRDRRLSNVFATARLRVSKMLKWPDWILRMVSVLSWQTIRGCLSDSPALSQSCGFTPKPTTPSE